MTSAITESDAVRRVLPGAGRLSAMAGHRRRPARARAFTLVEMLVVIGIIILLASVSGPMMVPALRSRTTNQAVEFVSGSFLRARSMAITQRKAYDVVINEADKSIMIREHRDSAPYADPVTDPKPLYLPENTWIDANRDGDRTDGDRFCWFTPTGGVRNHSSAGLGASPRYSVRITGPNNLAWVVRVYPTTGIVDVEED